MPPMTKALADERFRFFYSYLSQGTWWYPNGRPRVLITSMDARWRRNAARWMQRRAKLWEFYYSFGEILVMAEPTVRTVIGEDDDGNAVVAGPLLSQFDLMSDMTQDAFDQWSTERQADPLAWLLSTPLYRAMVTAPCCNGTGMADYAAVPCPAPDCPVPAPESPPEQSAEWQAREERKRKVGKHHLTECPMYPGAGRGLELGCHCDDYSPDWTLS